MSSNREQTVENGYALGQPLLNEAQSAQLYRVVNAMVPESNAANKGIEKILLTLARQPTLLNQLTAVVGPNLMLRNGDVFIKSSRSKREIAWHVDTCHPWPESQSLWNVWIALNPITARNGALEFLVKSQHHRFSNPIPDRHNLNLNDIQIAELADLSAVMNEMPAGHFSLHSFRTAHRSGANRSKSPRIALVLRVFSASTPPNIIECGEAICLKGTAMGWKAPKQLPISWCVQP